MSLLKATNKCQQCGVDFNPRRKEAKYCTRACYFEAGVKGRTANPDWQHTFICMGCGQEKTVPRSYTSTKKYCSNACAKRERKFGWSKRAVELDDGSLLIFRSNYELRFYAACLRFDIPCRSYDGPDIQTSYGVYRPDFIVYDNKTVEIKGWMDQESAVKVAEASEQLGDDFIVIDKQALLGFEDGLVKITMS